MAESRTPSDRRSEHAALLGLVVQIAAFALLKGTSYWAESDLLGVLSRFLLVGVPIWLVLYLILHQMHRVGLEALETAELRRAQVAGSSPALFELDNETLHLEQARLAWMVRWLLPSCTVLVSLVLIVGHFTLWEWSLADVFAGEKLNRTKSATLVMWSTIGAGFLCFLYARYTLALARMPQWGLLRAGAVCLAGNAFGCVLVALALMCSGTMDWTEPLLTYVLRVALLLLGVEFAANFILDLYRPRTAGEVARPSFDSRLMGMVAEPGGLAKSIAEAANYQFGFHVSSTWFYQLLQRWLFPLTVAVFAAVLALTSVVIVDADEQAVVERYGKLVEEPGAVLEPGIHLKWPFPKDIVYRVPVKRISELVIGDAEEEEEDSHGHDHGEQAILWTESHDFLAHLMLLVASPQRTDADDTDAEETAYRPTTSDGEESTTVSLLMVSVPIEYRIKDIRQYLHTYSDSVKLLEVITYQLLSDYATSVDVDELMGWGRAAFNKTLAARIQERMDKLGAGIEIVFAGIRGAHPPADGNVAAAFQSVVASETAMGATIHRAKGAARNVLTAIAGTESRALALDEAIRRRNEMDSSSPDFAVAQRKVDDLLMGNDAEGISAISGQAAALIAGARAKASRQTSRAATKAHAFGTHVAAYDAAPALYVQRKKLEIYAGLADVRKFLLVGDRSNVVVEYDPSQQAGLDQVLQSGLEDERNKRGGGS